MSLAGRIACILILALTAASPAAAEPSHGIAMRGEPALPADFTHLPYANPDAPKGGRLTYGVFGTFDDLNPFDLKSIRNGARGLWDPAFGNLVFQPLMMRSRDEPFTLYGLVARKAEMADDRSWIEFHIDPRARFSDGEPLTVDDVIFTFQLLAEKGRPPYSSRMKQVERMEKKDGGVLRITFNDRASRETPLLFALMPVLPAHATDPERFGSTTLDIPVGSGPYTVAEVKPGERITYRRDPDYWGKDLPVSKGFWNFDTIRVDYFRDSTAQFEAFKKGLFDVYPESSPAKWQTAYDFAAVSSGQVVRDSFERRTPSGMLGFVFNTRRKPFDDVRVRKALGKLFDFEWANENLFFNAYTRTSSYWQDSDLSSLDAPVSEGEKALLAPFPGRIEDAVADGSYRAPVSNGSGVDRKLLRSALSDLRKAGFRLDDGRMVGPDGEPLAFEILIAGSAGISGKDIERLALAYAKSAKRLGIDVSVRQVDDSQYQERKGGFDYDMTVVRYSSSFSPGAEQTFRWGSQSRDLEGSFNFAGTADPAIDAAIEAMLAARTEDAFRDAVRAYDRLLISGHYVVPLFHQPATHVARWSRIARPDYTPLYGPEYPTWWFAGAQ